LWDLAGVAPAAVLSERQREPDAKRAACISEVSQKPMVLSKGLRHSGAGRELYGCNSKVFWDNLRGLNHYRYDWEA
jgi:hypothetical protein